MTRLTFECPETGKPLTAMTVDDRGPPIAHGGALPEVLAAALLRGRRRRSRSMRWRWP